MPSSRLSPAKNQQVIVVCDSAAITAGDISAVLTALKSLSSDRSSAMSAEGAVTLVFHGYDDDPRELEAIPEVRTWFAQLFAAWPYWSFFANRIDQTVPLVLSPSTPFVLSLSKERTLREFYVNPAHCGISSST